MRLLRWLLLALALLLVPGARATTPSNIRLGVTTIATTGTLTYNALAHPTPLIVFTAWDTVITINGIAAGTNGEVVTILRSGFQGSVTINHANVNAIASEQIILPNGRTSISTAGGRINIQLVYYGAWYVLGFAV